MGDASCSSNHPNIYLDRATQFSVPFQRISTIRLKAYLYLYRIYQIFAKESQRHNNNAHDNNVKIVKIGDFSLDRWMS